MVQFKMSRFHAGANRFACSMVEKAAKDRVMVKAQSKMDLRGNIWKTHQSELILAVWQKTTPAAKEGSVLSIWSLQFKSAFSWCTGTIWCFLHFSSAVLFPGQCVGQVHTVLMASLALCIPSEEVTSSKTSQGQQEHQKPSLDCTQQRGQEEFSRVPASSSGQQ